MSELKRFDAPAWTADWLVGWLASLGLVSRIEGAKLFWSDDVVPHAVFLAPSEEAIEAAKPTIEEVEKLAIARNLEGHLEYTRNPTREAYRDRAYVARSHNDFSMGAATSDIGVVPKDPLIHSPFNTSTSGDASMVDRLLRLLSEIEDSSVLAALTGEEQLVRGRGLALDVRRLVSTVTPVSGGSRDTVFPLSEVFAFYAFSLFDHCGKRTRGWSKPPHKSGAFSWGTWSYPLDATGIDAWLSLFSTCTKAPFELTRYESVPYRKRGNENTPGFASREVFL